MPLKCGLCKVENQIGRPTVVRYEDVRSKKVTNAIFCARCDGMESWPNWARGLKDRAV